MSHHITLLIPGLRPSKQFVSELGRLEQKEIPALTHLNRILSHADRIPAADVIRHDYLLQLLTRNVSQTNQWPLAKWRLTQDKLGFETGEHDWLCADPVYIHPDRSELLLLAHEELCIGEDESHQLVSLINRHFQDEPWELHVGTSYRWYIRLKDKYDLKTISLWQVMGKNIFDYLPSGEHAGYWQQRMNEIQMLLHSSEVNQEREESGLMPVNSLWLWGYATGEQEQVLHWQKVYTDDAVLKGLALLSGCEVSDLPDDLEDKLRESDDIKGDVLFYNPRLLASLQQNDIFNWLDEVEYLEKYWFAPLLKYIRTKPGMQVNLLMDDKEAFQLKAKHLKRWWRLVKKNRLFKA